MRRLPLVISFLAFLGGMAPLAVRAATSETVEGVLAASRHPWLKWPDLSDWVDELRRLYAQEPDGLVWFEGEAIHPAAAAAVETLVVADTRGLSPEDYDAPLLLLQAREAVAPDAREDTRALFDLALSVGLLRHFSDLHRGRVDPRAVGFGYDAHGDDHDLVGLLLAARDDGRVELTAAGLEPQYAVYKRLKLALPRFVALGKGPALPEAPEVRKLSPGDEYASLEALAARLRAFGDLGPDEPLPLRYEGPLVEAVKRLQDRFGFEADGILGRDTFRAVNRDPRSLAEQVELALERLRWLPDLTQRNAIVVNVPAFQVWVFEADKVPSLTMRVVVGKALRHDTPIFYGEMTYLTFRPYWNVPYSIATKELLPKIRTDSGYLAREQMEIVQLASPDAGTYPPTPENLDAVKRGTLRVRQRPGPKNALGRVVFSFPNDDHIFMHDTPSHSVFARSRRDFSHGCIRLEDPMAMARWVLRDQPEWTEEKVAAALEGDRPVWVGLLEPLPVVIFYATAFVDSQGSTRFGDDIYGLDERLREAIAGGYPYPRGAVGHPEQSSPRLRDTN